MNWTIDYDTLKTDLEKYQATESLLGQFIAWHNQESLRVKDNPALKHDWYIYALRPELLRNSTKNRVCPLVAQ